MRKEQTSNCKNKMSPDGFDPFSNRMSRDIRNTLSESFVEALARKDHAEYRAAAAKWLATKPAAIYVKYIHDRLRRYDHVLERITVIPLEDARLQSLVIWNNRLFFEFHDHLERMWQQATGNERLALKGLIQAAGVYIHMEHDHGLAVKSLSTKSLELLRRYSFCLKFINNLNDLMDCLKNMNPVPPRLENPALWSDPEP